MKDIKSNTISGGLIVLLAFFIILPLGAEPVWSGNASVDAEEFVNFIEDTPLAGASSSFTRNTVVEVTNPQNGRSIEITIVKRAPRPGVFLVISAAAGEALSFPADQVNPVQVRVASNTKGSAYDSRFESSDPDINPAVNLPAEKGVPATPDEVFDDTGTSAESGASGSGSDTFLHEPVPVPVPDEPAGGLLVMTDKPAADTEDVITEKAEPEADSELPADLITENSDKDNVIYFLTPSDFRPPAVPAAALDEEIVPVYVERDVLEGRIADQLNNGSSYIQLGAYSTAALVYSEMESIASRYPMVVWTEETAKGTIYKLLIGPLTADETGVLVYRFKTGGYPDLFHYRP